MRSRNGEKTYQFAEGEAAGVLRLVFKALEPVPAIDTFVESDWKIKRDTINGNRTVRVLAGYESPEGKLDPEQATGYWFDDTGLLVKTYFMGIETRQLEFEDFAGVKIARRIDVLRDEKMGMRIRVTEVSSAGPVVTRSGRHGMDPSSKERFPSAALCRCLPCSYECHAPAGPPRLRGP